jgi:hypothetical protein
VCIQVLGSLFLYKYPFFSDPTYNDVIIISAEKNADQSSSFQDDVKEIQGEGTLKSESIVVGGQLTDDFLNVTNDKNSSC